MDGKEPVSSFSISSHWWLFFSWLQLLEGRTDMNIKLPEPVSISSLHVRIHPALFCFIYLLILNKISLNVGICFEETIRGLLFLKSNLSCKAHGSSCLHCRMHWSLLMHQCVTKWWLLVCFSSLLCDFISALIIMFIGVNWDFPFETAQNCRMQRQMVASVSAFGRWNAKQPC